MEEVIWAEMSYNRYNLSWFERFEVEPDFAYGEYNEKEREWWNEFNQTNTLVFDSD